MAGRRSPVASAMVTVSAPKPNESGLTVRACLQPHAFTPEEDFVPGQPGLGAGRTLGLAEKLPLQPGNIAGRKAPGFRQRSAARNGDAGRAVGSQPQDIAPRPAVADKPEPHGPRTHLEPAIIRCGGRLGSKEPFELHPLI